MKKKKKGINFMVLLLFFILAIVLSVFLTLYYSKVSATGKIKMAIQNNINNTNSTVTITDSNTIEYDTESSNYSDMQTSITDSTQESQELTINNHTFKINQSAEATVQLNNSKEEISIKNNDQKYEIEFGTDNTYTFSNIMDNLQALSSNSDRIAYIRNNFNVQPTKNIQTGDLENLNLIMCSISDSDVKSYFIITQLTDSEILYAKISNLSSNELIDDLSSPLSDISSIIKSMS